MDRRADGNVFAALTPKDAAQRYAPSWRYTDSQAARVVVAPNLTPGVRGERE